MKLTVLTIKNTKIAVLESIPDPISNIQDVLDLIGNADNQGARKIIIKREHLHENFFDLKTKLAGDIMQKIINYYKYLVVVGDFSDLKKKSWLDFMYESKRAGRIMFVEDAQEAVKLLTRE